MLQPRGQVLAPGLVACAVAGRGGSRRPGFAATDPDRGDVFDAAVEQWSRWFADAAEWRLGAEHGGPTSPARLMGPSAMRSRPRMSAGCSGHVGLLRWPAMIRATWSSTVLSRWASGSGAVVASPARRWPGDVSSTGQSRAAVPSASPPWGVPRDALTGVTSATGRSRLRAPRRRNACTISRFGFQSHLASAGSSKGRAEQGDRSGSRSLHPFSRDGRQGYRDD